MRVEDTLTMRRFPVVVQTDCRNIDRIYPLKQKQVSEIYRQAKRFPIIRKVIVFGSSVTPRCRSDRGGDLWVAAGVSDGMKVFEMQKALGEACDWNCDMVIYDNIGSALKQTVQREGVVIYK